MSRHAELKKDLTTYRDALDLQVKELDRQDSGRVAPWLRRARKIILDERKAQSAAITRILDRHVTTQGGGPG